MPNKLADTDLFRAIVEADDEGIAAGEEVRQRAGMLTMMRAMTRLGFDSYPVAGPATPPELERIQAMLKSFYQPEDWQVGGVHMGAILFRDTFARVSVPYVVGRTGIDPLQFVQLPQLLLVLLKSRGEFWRPYLDQFTDLFDFGWGMLELGQARPVSVPAATLFGLAHFQIQAAGATVTGAYDFRGAVQSAILGTELSLKAGLAAHAVESRTQKARA